MGELFPNQSYGRVIYKHTNLPLYQTDEFNFFRCISFSEGFYGKTVSVLHAGNLREGTAENRYALLFGKRKVLYWVDSLQTARAEIKYHNLGNNLISFWAYDDATSTIVRFPVKKKMDGDDDGNEMDMETNVPFQIAYAVSIHKAQGFGL